MRRRDFIAWGGGATAWPLAARSAATAGAGDILYSTTTEAPHRRSFSAELSVVASELAGE